MPLDMSPATKRMAELVRGVPDEALANPTPSDIPLGTLLDHVRMLSLAFTAAARRDFSTFTGPPPPPDAANLGVDWRERIPRSLEALAAAWSEPEAWTGMTRAGGLDMPAEVAGVVALDEIVVHGWDVARSTGQPYDVEPTSSRPFTTSSPRSPSPTHRCRGKACSARPFQSPPTPRCSTASSASPAATRPGRQADTVEPPVAAQQMITTDEEVPMGFSDDEIAYLRSQPITRFATVGPGGQPDVVPLAFEFDGQGFWIGGVGDAVAGTRKFRNVAAGNDRVALVFDDLVSVDPFAARCLRVYGRAGPPVQRESAVVGPGLFMRITPTVSWSWNLRGEPAGATWYPPRRTTHEAD